MPITRTFKELAPRLRTLGTVGVVYAYKHHSLGTLLTGGKDRWTVYTGAWAADVTSDVFGELEAWAKKKGVTVQMRDNAHYHAHVTERTLVAAMVGKVNPEPLLAALVGPIISEPRLAALAHGH